MARDWHFGFSCVVTVVEAEAANNGGFIRKDGGKRLGDCHCLLGTRPSNTEPVITFASIFFFSTDATPRSG